MRIPQIAIVGRPNVGKSSIFNWLVGRRLAIVDDVAGITRDRMIHVVEHEDRYFEIVDTGGIGINDVDDLTSEIEEQISFALHSADVIVFVVDVQDGLTPLDQNVAERLRAIDKPLLLVANKADNDPAEINAGEFFQMGVGEPLPVSAKQNRRKQRLLDALVEKLPPELEMADEPSDPEMKMAIVGRRNVGKSTFINAITGEPRVIVSEVAGTTRDSIDVRFELDGKSFVAIDTPGLRKGKSIRTDVEFYSTHRAKRSIRHADVVLMFFDSSSRISKVDRQLCSYIDNQFKPCIFVVNKWDLMADHMPTQRWADYLRDNFSTMWNAPIAFVTALNGRNVKKLINHAQMLFKQSRLRVPTPKLNRLIKKALQHHPPPIASRRRPKIYFAVQIGIQPPTIVLKCNDPASFPKSYRRYLLGVLRDELPFGEVPIRMFLEKRVSSDSVGATDLTEIESLEDEFVPGKVSDRPDLNES
jgi:GTP-binding protein